MRVLSRANSGTPPPFAKSPPLQSPPPPPGDRHFHGFLVNMYCAGLCCPSALRLALLSQYYKSSTCVCSVIFSLQRRCMAAPKARGKAAPQPRGKPAAKRTGLAVQAGAKVCLEIPLQSPPPPPRETVTW